MSRGQVDGDEWAWLRPPGHWRALLVGTTGVMTDAALLERFVDRDREASQLAFAELVARHSPMVLRVCQTILHDAHDAEDAFQATFLVLARRAESIRKRASAASWLYGVARRVAMCARLSRSRQWIHERKAAELTRSSADATGWDDQFEVLHDEIARLSDRYRVVIVLCDLEGLTEGQAAVRLGLPVGTVRSRLRRGRERLRGRLLSRGVTLSTLVFGSTSVSDGAPVVVSTALASSATRVASFYAAARDADIRGGPDHDFDPDGNGAKRYGPLKTESLCGGLARDWLAPRCWRQARCDSAKRSRYPSPYLHRRQRKPRRHRPGPVC